MKPACSVLLLGPGEAGTKVHSVRGGSVPSTSYQESEDKAAVDTRDSAACVSSPLPGTSAFGLDTWAPLGPWLVPGAVFPDDCLPRVLCEPPQVSVWTASKWLGCKAFAVRGVFVFCSWHDLKCKTD